MTVLTGLGRALHFSGLPDRVSEVTQQAVEMARRLGDTAVLVKTLGIAANSDRSRPEGLQQRLAATKVALESAEMAGNQEMAMYIYSWYLVDLLEAGDAQRVNATRESFEQRLDQIREPFWDYILASYRASFAIAEGNFEEAEVLANRALVLGRRLKGKDPSGAFGMQMFIIRKQQGRLQEVASAVQAFVQHNSASAAWRPGLTLLYRELDMAAEARTEFEHLAADDFAALPKDALLVVCLAYLAEVCAFLGDVGRAATLYRLMQPWSGRNVVVGVVAYHGAASRYLGMLAATMSRWDAAERHFQDALEMDSKMGARTWLAHTQLQYAEMLLDRGRAEDGANAAALLSDALATSKELGMQSLEAHVAASLERKSGPQDSAPSYPDGLSEREVEVLRLISLGKSNRVIAEDLFISANTVANHVRNILTKTGLANRTAAAAYAIHQSL